MRGRLTTLWGGAGRLRHAASRFQQDSAGNSAPDPSQDWIDCVRTQKSFAVCDALWSNHSGHLVVLQEEGDGTAVLLLNGTSLVVQRSSVASTLGGLDNSTSDSSDRDETDVRELYKVMIPVMLIACVLSMLFNLVIVFSVRWVRKALSPTLYLSLSLAVADAYASLVLGLGLVVNSLLPIVYGVDLGPFNACFVLTLEAFRLGGVVVSVLHLLALAVNHYVGILRPLHYAATVTRRTVFWAMGAMWLLPVLFFLAYFSLVPGDGFRSPYCSSYEFLLRVPFRATFSALFFVPLVLMSAMYAHMFAAVRRHRRGVAQLESCGSGGRQLHRSVKAVITTLLILGTYLLGWMPAVLYFVLTCLDHCPAPFTGIRLWVRVPVGILINSCIVAKSFVDPIIYVVRMPEIKAAVRALCGTQCGLRPVATDADATDVQSVQHRLTSVASRRIKEGRHEPHSPNGCVGGAI